MKDAEKLREEIRRFQEVTKQFYEGKISVAEYKGFSGGFGSYAQRGGKVGMLRLRLTGGRITKESLRFIVESIEKYKIDRLHMTTCQTVQFHNLEAGEICSLVKEAWEYGIITKGCGGNYPRNVMMSPLSGVRQGEPFDVTGYAMAAADYLMDILWSVELPRKLKVCFSNSGENTPHATFRDLGFVAKADGTFDVYSAGGLGRNPMMGVLVAEGVKPTETLYHIKAMLDTFVAHGNYQNRAKARTRYMQEALGKDGYRRAYRENLKKALEEEDLSIRAASYETTKKGDGTISHPRAIAQKQPGLYAVFYHPAGGSPEPSLFRKLYDAIDKMEGVEIRLSPDEGMYLINCTAGEAKKLLELTEDGAQTLFETSVACIGNHICQLGVRDSQSLLKECIDAVRPYHFADGVLPKIHISGCPSSCGTQQIGSLGFRGAVKQTPDGPKAAFAVLEGGNQKLGRECFGEELGVMEETNIPGFLVELGRTIQKEHMTYDGWAARNHDALIGLIRKYCG